jgi:hypothetical protein
LLPVTENLLWRQVLNDALSSLSLNTFQEAAVPPKPEHNCQKRLSADDFGLPAGVEGDR